MEQNSPERDLQKSQLDFDKKETSIPQRKDTTMDGVKHFDIYMQKRI